ncbi:hypothetical protein BN1723_017656 [Verticillium longisporum]|uniref:Uncharacterized protein n=1 Tax=Verticillium longisporum TaxID=100787 RepID=A0A0G4L9T8_VERLO|nr:hypothetical protein BN1723_017656 [Verticillium longisporum]
MARAKMGSATLEMIFSDGSNLSNDILDAADASSEGASSADGTARRSGSFTQTTSSDPRQVRASFVPSVLSDSQTISGETVASTNSGPLARMARPWERNSSVSVETRSLADSMGTSDMNRQSVADSTASSLSRQLGSAKFRRRGHCEIITIEGVAGLGKSFLFQSVFAEARKRGYYVSAKFDNARRQAFGPLLKLLSSLFRQVFGEKHTDTPFHHALKHYIRPVWPMLAKALGLPEHLLGTIDNSTTRSPPTFQGSRNMRNSMKHGLGLGLSICKSLIETMMKGKIHLESQEGVGTTAWFTVTFDKATPDVNAGDAQTVKSPPIADRFTIPATPLNELAPNPFIHLTAIPKDQIRICIAEDNLINQNIAIKFSRRLGYTTVDAYNSPPNRHIALYVLYQLVPLIFLVAFFVLEAVLVLRILGETRPMIYLTAALVLFTLGQVFNYVVSSHICDGTNGALDGALFQTLFTLLSVVMVWIFWSSITEDDWPMQVGTAYP